MREIKFRVWDAHAKMMTLVPHLMNIFTGEISDLPDRFFLMQYTGLKDKNGKEIYEGDILSREEEEPLEDIHYDDICIVEWVDSAWRVKFEDEILLIDDYGASTGEVIGNIHENPDLLK